MKKLALNIIGISILGMSLVACGSAEQNTSKEAKEEKSKSADMEGMEAVDLSAYDLNASIQLPNDDKGMRSIQLTDWGSVEIKVGDQFGIEIVPFGLSMEEMKTELAGDLVYNINYVEESPSLVIYEKSIADSEVAPETHFFYSLDMEGELLEIKSLASGSYSRAQIDKMLASAKSFKMN